MLEDLQMVDKTKTHAKYLSGGMKRKLRYMQLSLIALSNFYCTALGVIGLHVYMYTCICI